MQNYTNKKALVTGANGFLGKHLCKKLLEKGTEVIGYNRHFEDNFIFKNPKFNKITGDINDKANLKKIPKVDIVFHLAAQPYVWYAKKYPSDTFKTNVLGTLNILELAKNFNSKIIFSSTTSVYDNNKVTFKEEDAQPNSVYGLSKFIAEKYIQQYAKEFNVKYTILRFSHIYGPYMKSRIIYDIIKCVLNNEKEIKLFMNPKNKLDFLYVDDAADAMLLAGLNKKAENEIINIGSGELAEIEKIIDLILNISEKRKIRICKSNYNYEIKNKKLDINKAKRILGWNAQTNINEGIKTLLDGLNANNQ